MLMSHCGSGPAVKASKANCLIGALIAASLSMSAVQAATFGHSRIVSALGQPLHVEIPVSQLTQQEIDSLRATPAPASAWREAGMTPPVALDSMRLVLLDGYRSGVKVIQLRSEQAFDQPIVDILLDLRSVSGQQRYQVSLLAHADQIAVRPPVVDTSRNARVIDGRGALRAHGEHTLAGRKIPVQRGDNMFAIAQRNAVPGVTVYQMMMALQRTNPQAFIEDNVNLVKAGATLVMPDMDALTALSDREARRLFQQHAQAFVRYRQRSSTADVAALSAADSAVHGSVSEAVAAVPETSSPVQTGDRLRLSGAAGVNGIAVGKSGASAARLGGQPGSGAAAEGNSTGLPGAASLGNANGGDPGRASVGQAPSTGSTASGQGASLAMAAAPEISSTNGTAAGDSPENGVAAAMGSAGAGSITGTVSSLERARNGAESARMAASNGASAVTTANGSGVGAGPAPDPDDEAAIRKGLDESRKRVIELEDNVRHLNEALQKQGHVAAEAALEGARSVSEAIKEAISLIDSSDKQGTDAAGVGETPAADNAAGTAQSAPGGAGASGSAERIEAGSPDNTAARPDAEASKAANAGATSSTQPPAVAAPSSSQRPAAGVTTEGASSRPSQASAERQTSWWSDNFIAVLGSGLAFILLLIVWLLRRASATRQDDFESDSPISDAMVREKLREIDLDLDTPPTGAAGRRGP